MFVKLTTGIVLNTRCIAFIIPHGKASADATGVAGHVAVERSWGEVGAPRLMEMSLNAEDFAKVEKACLESADDGRKD